MPRAQPEPDLQRETKSQPRWRTRHVGAMGWLLVVCLGLITSTLQVLPIHAGLPALPLQQPTGEPVYAILGRLRPALQQSFDTYLLTNDQQLIGLFGRTPEIEVQIIEFRKQGSDFRVKVWGTYYAQGRTSTVPEIVVDAITAADAPAPVTLTPAATVVPVEPVAPVPGIPIITLTPTLIPGTPVDAMIVVKFQSVFLRAGPGTHYPSIGGLDFGAICTIIGRNAAASWWQIRCPDGKIAWIANDVVTIRGSTALVPTVEFGPPPTPTATPVVPTPPPPLEWQASFWANRTLTGQPLITQSVPAVRFDWGVGSPGGGLPADNFSARFERTVFFPTATYEVEVTVDDGVRVWIDNQLIIDDWQVLSERTLRVQRLLAGNHDIRIDYFEGEGEALLDFSIEQVRSSSDWQVSYYDNPELGSPPVLRRSEPRGQYPIDANWGAASPVVDVVPVDQWSARYVGRFYFESGNYQFLANVDDGVRVYIDGIRVLDAWTEGYKEVGNQFFGIGAGNHEVTVEFLERAGNASLRVWWYRIGPTGGSRDE